MGEPYLVKYSPSGSVNKVSDFSTVNGEIILEAVETPSGTYFYAVPRKRVVHDGTSGAPVVQGIPLAMPGKNLPDTTLELLTRKNQELEEKNAALQERCTLLSEQNNQLIERLFSLAAMALEKSHAVPERPSNHRPRTTSPKGARARSRAGGGEGPEEEG